MGRSWYEALLGSEQFLLLTHQMKAAGFTNRYFIYSEAIEKSLLAFALHAADPDSIPGTAKGFLGITRCDT